MTLAIKMRGEIDEILIPASFDVFVANLNVAGASGKQFVILSDVDDHPVAFNMPNVLTVREIDDLSPGMIG